MTRTVAAILGIALVGVAAPSTSQMERYLHAQRLVSIGKIRLNLYCTGAGTPTVILDSGLGGSTVDWRKVQEPISSQTRVCSYDRAGMGFSDGTTAPRDAGTIVTELHTLLHNANIAPPYVIVAHSVAGEYAVLFADRYRAEVKGMVLVEPQAPHADQRTDAVAPADSGGVGRAIAFFHGCYAASVSNDAKNLYARCLPSEVQLKQQCEQDGPTKCSFDRMLVHQRDRPLFWYDAFAEISALDSINASEVAKAQRSYGSMPLIVLTAANSFVDPHVPVDQQSAEWGVWKTIHDEIAAHSSTGASFVVADSGHYIQLDQPKAVISAVWEVVEQARH